MRTELSAKSQKTLFEFIITKLGLSDGDIIDVSEQNGKLIIMPADDILKKKFTLSDTHTPNGKPKRLFATKEEYLTVLEDLCGSISDPTMVEPEEIKYESFRESII
jgi:hypothetical protein